MWLALAWSVHNDLLSEHTRAHAGAIAIEFCAVASNRMKWYRDGGVRAMVAVLVLGLVFPPLWWGGIAHLRTKPVGLAILSVFFASLATVTASIGSVFVAIFAYYRY